MLFSAVGLCAQTNTYTFVTAQSTVRQVNVSGGIDRLYTISGSFQLSTDTDAGTARFDWVDAALSPATSLETRHLEELFRMTELTGTLTGPSTILFVLNPASPDPDDTIQITVTLQAGGALLAGQYTTRTARGSTFTLNAYASVQAAAGWTYRYYDDFSTGKAQTDSYAHSVFWPANAFPPAEPYLSYFGSGQGRALAFVGYVGQPAHLGYRFPLGPTPDRHVRGSLGIDVAFPSNALISQTPPGYLMVSLSDDGTHWSTPEALDTGRHEIPIESLHGTCYVMFLGASAMIDNLSVDLASPAATIRVPQDYPTIQQALNAAADGDVVEVGPGTWRGDGNNDLDFLGKAVTLRSSGGPDSTVIDCAGSGGQPPHNTVRRGVYFHSNESRRSILQGFTIRAGRAQGDAIPPDDMRWNLDPGHPIGGGIYIEFASPTIVNCRVVNCGAEYGGGIGSVGGQPAIIHCRVENCTAGGLGAAESGGFGGGIALIRGCQATITGCTITGNTTYFNSRGAGIYIRRSTARITDCDISFNTPPNENALTIGGGLCCEGSETAVTLTHCILSYNTAHMGAALYAERAPDIAGLPACSIRIVNCTVANNAILPGPWMRPAIEAAIETFGCDTRVRNTIAYYNQGVQITIVDPAVNSPVTYCDVQGGYPGTGNISADPRFAPVATRDYHLQSLYGRYDPRQSKWVKDTVHSPCIDAGDPDDYFAREPHPNGRHINMGAYGGTEQASMGTGSLVYHVDIATGDDGNSGLSRQRAFRTIQRGIDVARNNDTVLVWPGVYPEEIAFKGKAITVESAAEAAHIVPAGGYAFSFYFGEGPRSVLRKFVIRDTEFAVFCQSASPTISNLTIANNQFGIAGYGGADPNISNCIFYGNAGGDLFQCRARYSRGSGPGFDAADGNIGDDPLFVDPNNGDYHLRSEAGRYWPQHDVWVLDDQSSPCLDAGDPDVSPGAERAPNGSRLNMGAYGGTRFASMTRWRLAGDVNRDGIVSFHDVAELAGQWLEREGWGHQHQYGPVMPNPGQWQFGQ